MIYRDWIDDSGVLHVDLESGGYGLEWITPELATMRSLAYRPHTIYEASDGSRLIRYALTEEVESVIAFPERIDPMKEAAELIAKIPKGPVSPFGDACQECGGELAGCICKGCGSKVVIMGLPVADYATLFVPQLPNGDSFREFVDFTLQKIAASLGIPASLICSRAQHVLDDGYRDALAMYRKHIGRLPGSERTSRLRKKRRTRVVDWYLNEYLGRVSYAD